MEKYDAIIIGFGKGGKTLASELAAKGEKVAVIEKSEKMYGGTCINVGCIPSKSLVHSAAAAKELFLLSDKKEAYRAAVAEKRWVVELLREKNMKSLQTMKIFRLSTEQRTFQDRTQCESGCKVKSASSLPGKSISIRVLCRSIFRLRASKSVPDTARI